jgi:hypothetical protein
MTSVRRTTRREFLATGGAGVAGAALAAACSGSRPMEAVPPRTGTMAVRTLGRTGLTLSEIYAGRKADLRPIHDAFMAAIGKFGAFEIAPKKGYVSLRRKKQFAMIGPGSKTRVDIGINVKGVKGSDRLVELPPGGMCQYKVALTDPKEVDKELIGWVKQAFDAAG